MMTLEQLAIFVAVAEREHLTRGAVDIGLTPSAASAAIKSLEAHFGVALFSRVGRGIELTRTGRTFLPEARTILEAVRNAEGTLSELGALRTGALDIHASQTVGNYWLPPRLLHFSERFPGISIRLKMGNTAGVVRAVLSGEAELGFAEGTFDEAALAMRPVVGDRLVIVAAADLRPAVANLEAARLVELRWVMREPGSGTRSELEAALGSIGIDPATLPVAIELPTNEAILNALRGSRCVAALSEMVVAPFLETGELIQLPVALPERRFSLVHHKERKLSAAATRFAMDIKAL
jgi:DNA-binding transcriptional LysR family regulator